MAIKAENKAFRRGGWVKVTNTLSKHRGEIGRVKEVDPLGAVVIVFIDGATERFNTLRPQERPSSLASLRHARKPADA